MEQPRALAAKTTPEIFLQWLASQTRTMEKSHATANGGVVTVQRINPSDARQEWDKLTDPSPIYTEIEIKGLYYPDEAEIMNLTYDEIVPRLAYRQLPNRTRHEYTLLPLIRIILTRLDKDHIQIQTWRLSSYVTPYYEELWKRIESGYGTSTKEINEITSETDQHDAPKVVQHPEPPPGDTAEDHSLSKPPSQPVNKSDEETTDVAPRLARPQKEYVDLRRQIVKANAAKTADEIAEILEKKNFKGTSVATVNRDLKILGLVTPRKNKKTKNKNPDKKVIEK